jgi:hypothetical protein
MGTLDNLIIFTVVQPKFSRLPITMFAMSVLAPKEKKDSHGLVLPFERKRAPNKKRWHHGDGLAFDPFDSFEPRGLLRFCLCLGSVGWISYLIVRGIGANIAYWLERWRDKPKSRKA